MTDDLLSAVAEELLDAARSEAKRFPTGSLTFQHLAIVLAQRRPKEFAAAFGDQAAAQFRDLLLTGIGLCGSETEVVALLESSKPEAPEHVLVALRDLISPQSAQVDGGAAVLNANPLRRVPTAPFISDRVARFVERVESTGSVRGRAALVDQVLALVGRRTPVSPLLVGRPGSGRTAIISALEARLQEAGYSGRLSGFHVLRVRGEALAAEDRIRSLKNVLADMKAAGGAVLAFDDFEVVAGLEGPRPDLDLMTALRTALGDPSLPIILCIDQRFEGRIELYDEGLSAQLCRVPVPLLAAELMASIHKQMAEELASFHTVTIDEEVLRFAALPPSGEDVLDHPGLFADRLDSACAQAALRPQRRVAKSDLEIAESASERSLNAAALVGTIERFVLGQEVAIRSVTRRLALTRAGLDLHPERPDGVFLFVGPTGVGKTQLAKAISCAVFGDERPIIRLDMSEYAQEWALSRLIGPQPGYVGFSEPESWLTTRIRRQPDTVLLLDEIEKAHPTVWNAFLQVFDAGRLTDARGNVADLSRTIIVMTSNIGAGEFSSDPMGFGPSDSDPVSAVRRRVSETMAPELLNRLDEVVVFSPIPYAVIVEIARKEVAAVVERLRTKGFVLEVDEGIPDLLAASGYNPDLGARHLHRNIERLFLAPLADTAARWLRASSGEHEVIWEDLSAG